jgi:hypothetical protein
VHIEERLRLLVMYIVVSHLLMMSFFQSLCIPRNRASFKEAKRETGRGLATVYFSPRTRENRECQIDVVARIPTEASHNGGGCAEIFLYS